MFFFCGEGIRHNLISYNQLAHSKQFVTKGDHFWVKDEDDDGKSAYDNLIYNYYDCLTECDDDSQTCKRLCREVLRT